jgi:hypothetical protein
VPTDPNILARVGSIFSRVKKIKIGLKVLILYYFNFLKEEDET